MGVPQISLFAYYMGPSQIIYFAYYMGTSLRSVSSLTIWGPTSGQFFRLLCGPPPQISFFSYYMGASLMSFYFFTICPPPPSCQFLRLLYGGPQVSFFAYYMGPLTIFFSFFIFYELNLNYPWGAPIFFKFLGGGKCPLLSHLRAPMFLSIDHTSVPSSKWIPPEYHPEPEGGLFCYYFLLILLFHIVLFRVLGYRTA